MEYIYKLFTEHVILMIKYSNKDLSYYFSYATPLSHTILHSFIIETFLSTFSESHLHFTNIYTRMIINMNMDFNLQMKYMYNVICTEAQGMY